MVPILWPTARNRELRSALDVLDTRVARMIAERRARPGSQRDLLSLLLDARDEDGHAMSDKQVRDEVVTLFVAGHETTATGLAWSLMLLAQHRDVYDRVRSEVDAIGRVPTFEDLPRLSLTLRVFKEALRLYPPVYMFGRISIADVEVGDYLVPKGTVVLVAPFALHRKASVWPDPERFDPERFSPEQEAKRHRAAYIPFSAGPRTCIGNHFALMEGPLVLATLLHHADYELVDPRGTQPDSHATLRPRGGIPMRVTLRRAAMTVAEYERRIG
jgi:cytochrome P450